MDDKGSSADFELLAIQTIHSALEPLDPDARGRVIDYIVARFDLAALHRKPNAAKQDQTTRTIGGSERNEEAETADAFKAFAELFDAVQPQTASQKALVGGYWLQVCQGADNFDGQSVNKELKNLGHGLVNVTQAIEALKTQSPALALQLKKAGSTRQARKLYKITVAGETAVRELINKAIAGKAAT